MPNIGQILEQITGQSTVAGGIGTLLEWITGVLKETQSTAAPSVAKSAVEAHIADLEENKDAIVAAVTANTSENTQAADAATA